MIEFATNIAVYVVTFAYFFAALALFVYGLNCYVMIYLMRRRMAQTGIRQRETIAKFIASDKSRKLPPITIQLPIYNELNVVERVIRSASSIDYPKDLLEIQVLDDSTDETSAMADRIVDTIAATGIDIKVVRRNDRSGFKAGALGNALSVAKGEFIAIFDADFVPTADFLYRSVPFFLENPQIGLIQCRWGHINSNNSLLTRTQAIGMDGHFMIEQSARSWNGLYMNFNGTAGIWRRQAIADAGGWQCDTLTEDMDLSYRMQMAGWKTDYLIDLVVPAEVPEDITAFKSQQFRWAKGSIQTAMKLMPQVMAAEGSWFKKLQAFMHMTHYLVHPLMLALALLSLPVLLTFNMPASKLIFMIFAAIMLFATCAPSTLYVVSQKLAHKDWLKRILILPALVIIGVGLAVSNTLAVLQALAGHKSGFVRTPKKGDKELKRYSVKIPWVTFFELAAGLYCLVAFCFYLRAGKYLVGPFLGIYCVGFLFVGILTLIHTFSVGKMPVSVGLGEETPIASLEPGK